LLPRSSIEQSLLRSFACAALHAIGSRNPSAESRKGMGSCRIALPMWIRTIEMAERDATLRLWDAATGQQIGPVMKHEREVIGALLTKDERRILSWSRDATLRLWDAAPGQQIGPVMKRPDSCTAATTCAIAWLIRSPRRRVRAAWRARQGRALLRS
jgi:WD40 repeat protein